MHIKTQPQKHIYIPIYKHTINKREPQANNKTHPKFAMGEYILLNTRNLPLQMVGIKKLAPLWVGPYTVLEVVNSNAYKLALLISLRLLHPVFNISVLKTYRGTVIPPPDAIQIDGDLEYEIADILAHRHVG